MEKNVKVREIKGLGLGNNKTIPKPVWVAMAHRLAAILGIEYCRQGRSVQQDQLTALIEYLKSILTFFNFIGRVYRPPLAIPWKEALN